MFLLCFNKYSYRESLGRKTIWKQLEMKQYFGYEIEICFSLQSIVIVPMSFVILSEFLDKYISISISGLIKWKCMICQLLSSWGRKMLVTLESPDEMYAIDLFHYCVAPLLFSFFKPLFQISSLLFMKNSGKNSVLPYEKRWFSKQIDNLNLPKCCCCSNTSLLWVSLKCNFSHWGNKSQELL